MHGDFSRLTFSPAKHFSAVLSQQGRVQVDADANEATQILLHYLRTLTADLLGPAAGPVGDTGNGGFEIGSALTGNLPDLTISAGRYYVDGLLCENDPGTAKTSYWGQPDAYLDPDRKTDQLPPAPFLVYLLAWERLITAAEDPAIREVALGDQAPDTTARTKLVWQVRAVPANKIFPSLDKVPSQPDPLTVGQLLRAWIEKLRGNPPQLRARARQPDATSTDPCITPPQARYRGLENQLYRVEVHTGNGHGPTGSGPTSAPTSATFTWSRENGSVVFPIIKIDNTEVFLESVGRDKRLSLEVGDWVEVVDDATASRFEPTTLLQVTDLNIADRIVTLSAAPAPPAGQDASRHPLLRRWDQQEPRGGDNALQIHEGVTDTDWIDLEDGIQIQFQPPLANQPPRTYWRGDYWLVPARTLTGDVEWPQGGSGPAWLPPFGVHYHVAPLAIVNATNNLTDQRCLFDPNPCRK